VTKLLRWTDEDPRVVLLGRVELDAQKHEMIPVRMLDGPGVGLFNWSAQAGEDLRRGDLVVLRGPYWVRA